MIPPTGRGSTYRNRNAVSTKPATSDYQVSLDTTLSSSVGIRTSPIDYSFVGAANGGTFPLANFDNGDLNFKPGDVVEATQRITTELQVKRDDYGFFVRATGFYDPVIDSNVNGFQFPFSRAAERDIGADLRLLDAYVFARPEIGDHPFDLRVGNQALNWGESTFIQFGINSITPLDLTALRTPGSELRTAFLPIPAVDIRTDLAWDTSFEAFWQPYWTRTRLEPVGSFFGTNDAAADGGKFIDLYSYYADSPACVYAADNVPQANAFGGCVPRGLDRHPTGVDEFGFALRKTVPEWNDAEFGLYFENYYSRTPFLDFHTGGPNIKGAPGPFGVLPAPLLKFLTSKGTEYFQNTYHATSDFFDDYPKNIKLVGFSWNLNAPGGVAIQGEISHRFDQPLQLATSDLSLAVTAPALCLFAKLHIAPGPQACAAAAADPVIQATGGIAGFDQDILGYKRYDVTQAQTTATKLFPAMPSMAINSVAVVGEIGFDYVHNFGHDAGLFIAPYTTDTNTADIGNPYATVDNKVVPGVNGTGVYSTKGLATQFSGAYTIAVVVDMPNVLPYGLGMKPTVSLQHDFVGTSPTGANAFVANTAAASVGATFTYLQAWSLGVQYTNHFPVFAGGKFYGLIDRDFVSATLSYEF
jgi:hypothetical protein